jgi:hypothetical protein
MQCKSLFFNSPRKLCWSRVDQAECFSRRQPPRPTDRLPACPPPAHTCQATIAAPVDSNQLSMNAADRMHNCKSSSPAPYLRTQTRQKTNFLSSSSFSSLVLRDSSVLLSQLARLGWLTAYTHYAYALFSCCCCCCCCVVVVVIYRKRIPVVEEEEEGGSPVINMKVKNVTSKVICQRNMTLTKTNQTPAQSLYQYKNCG